jgi:hypothetical protein
MMVKPPNSYIMSAFQGEKGGGIHESIIILILRHSGEGWIGELGGASCNINVGL